MRLVFISDTHGHHREMDVPDGDVLIHAGDMSRGRGTVSQVFDFNSWAGSLPHKKKIFTPGNHDLQFERDLPLCREMMSNWTVLSDEELIVDGIKFYGSPWQPWFHSWAYNLPRGPKLAAVWAQIPNDTDVLITHGPPKDILDTTYWDNENVGCGDLAHRVMEVCPKIHVFGHIHETYGEMNFGGIHFINASTCNLQYQPVNPPIVVEI